ncbi:hypothetical protein HDU87_002349 [Geranomyces variabilis]|uniref:RING-type domain-containing protein n=1 Tax=Geranomyces variabilis TaxID=109894 RepID=A0AAD5TC88_9FUNG|nr:hypothetical protein HDU87_002349 [Geranomyces variabilis]
MSVQVPTTGVMTPTHWVIYAKQIASAVVRITFLARFNTPCNRNMQAYFAAIIAVDALFVLPFVPVSIAEKRYPDWATSMWLALVKLLWSVCRMVAFACFIYGHVIIFRPSDCRDHSRHLYWLMVAETVDGWAMSMVEVVAWCILEYASNNSEAEPDPMERPPGGLSHRELRTLTTFFFRDQTAKSQLDEGMMVNNLEIKLDDRDRGDRQKTSGGNGAADTELVLPKLGVSPPTMASSGLECAICVEEYRPGDHLRELVCGHCFHKDCVDNWLLPDRVAESKGHRTCPLCVRLAVREALPSLRSITTAEAAAVAREFCS